MATTVQVYVNPKAGQFAGARILDRELIGQLKPGAYKAKITKLRSTKADNFYHKILEIAAIHWPDGVNPDPKGDKELLRAWCQCKAGPHWRKSLTGPPEAKDMVIAAIEALKGDGKYAFVEEIATDDGPKLRLHIPLSIDHDHMGEDEIRPLRDKVFEIIEFVFEMTPKQLLEHHVSSVQEEVP